MLSYKRRRGKLFKITEHGGQTNVLRPRGPCFVFHHQLWGMVQWSSSIFRWYVFSSEHDQGIGFSPVIFIVRTVQWQIDRTHFALHSQNQIQVLVCRTIRFSPIRWRISVWWEEESKKHPRILHLQGKSPRRVGDIKQNIRKEHNFYDTRRSDR